MFSLTLKPAVMPQVTLSVPQEKLPILNDFLQALGIEEKNFPMYNKSSNNDTERETSAVSSFLQTYFGWEYYCNELEFE